jgi:hypothetical protein
VNDIAGEYKYDTKNVFKPRNYSFIEYALEALFIYINFDFGDHSNNFIHYWKKATLGHIRFRKC